MYRSTRNLSTQAHVVSCIFFVLIAVLLCQPIFGANIDAADDPLLRAMQDELSRTMQELQLEGLERPYFAAYTITDSVSADANASFGSPIASQENRQRWLSVDLRVGDYALDNSNFLQMPSFGRGSRSFGLTPLPLDDDYREIRRQVWLATDRAYKAALEVMAKKKAALKNVTRSVEIADFSRQEAIQDWRKEDLPSFDRAAAELLVRDLSAIFRQLPSIQTSEVSWQAVAEQVRYVNSEGTTFLRTQPSIRLSAWAAAQAKDGLPLSDFATFYGRQAADLPSAETMGQEILAMGTRLEALTKAELLERYNGPVLFTGQAAAEVFAQVLMPKLLAQRKPIVADARLAQMLNMGGDATGDYKDRIGARILPRSLSVIDNPNLARNESSIEVGSYHIDDQGVPAAKTTLVERGYLKTLLAGRTPVNGVETSSANFRGGGVVPSNVLMESNRGLGEEELRQELLQLVADRGADYGILIRRIANPAITQSQQRGGGMRIIGLGGGQGQGQAPPLIAAYKVFPDGREELLRNVEMVGLSASTFKEIVATGDRTQPYRSSFSPVGGSPFSRFSRRTAPMVSYRVPSLLFEELTLKRPEGEIPKLPVVESPGFSD